MIDKAEESARNNEVICGCDQIAGYTYGTD
jgi:hypothetical protein